MDKITLLETLKSERRQWETLLAQVDDGRMTQPGVSGRMAVKDIIAHVTWAERETVGMLEARAVVGSELWRLPQDERNAVVFEQNRDRSLAEVTAEARQVFQELLAAVQALTEEELVDPAMFAALPGDWLPWQVIAANSYRHYHQHRPDILAWIELHTQTG